MEGEFRESFTVVCKYGEKGAVLVTQARKKMHSFQIEIQFTLGIKSKQNCRVSYRERPPPPGLTSSGNDNAAILVDLPPLADDISRRCRHRQVLRALPSVGRHVRPRNVPPPRVGSLGSPPTGRIDGKAGDLGMRELVQHGHFEQGEDVHLRLGEPVDVVYFLLGRVLDPVKVEVVFNIIGLFGIIFDEPAGKLYAVEFIL